MEVCNCWNLKILFSFFSNTWDWFEYKCIQINLTCISGKSKWTVSI